jgi:hypothetical protein
MTLSGDGLATDDLCVLDELQELGVISPDFDVSYPWGQDPQLDVLTWADLDAAVQVDGQPDALRLWDRFCQRVPRPNPHRHASDVASTIIEWASAGTIGNLAWHVVTRLVPESHRSRRGSNHLSADEFEAFASMALAERIGQPPRDLVLVSREEDRMSMLSGRRTWVPGVRWTFILLAPQAEYRVVLAQFDGARLPQLVSYSERASTRARFSRLTR